MSDYRNIRAEAAADQVRAAIRDGQDPLPRNNIVAAAARTLVRSDLPASIREAAGDLLDFWAIKENVDRPKGDC